MANFECKVCGKKWTGEYDDLQLYTCTCGSDNSIDGATGRELNGGIKITSTIFLIEVSN